MGKTWYDVESKEDVATQRSAFFGLWKLMWALCPSLSMRKRSHFWWLTPIDQQWQAHCPFRVEQATMWVASGHLLQFAIEHGHRNSWFSVCELANGHRNSFPEANPRAPGTTAIAGSQCSRATSLTGDLSRFWMFTLKKGEDLAWWCYKTEKSEL